METAQPHGRCLSVTSAVSSSLTCCIPTKAYKITQNFCITKK